MKLYGTNAFSGLWVKKELPKLHCEFASVLDYATISNVDVYLVNGYQEFIKYIGKLGKLNTKVLLFDIDEILDKSNAYNISSLSQLNMNIPDWKGGKNIDIIDQKVELSLMGSFLTPFNKIMYKPNFNGEKREKFQNYVINYLFIHQNINVLKERLEQFNTKRNTYMFDDLINAITNENLLKACKLAIENKWTDVERLCKEHNIKIFEIRYMYKIYEIQKNMV